MILRLDRVRISSLNFSSSRDARVSATPRRAYIEKWWGNKGGRAVSVNANLRRQQNGDIYLHTGFWLHPSRNPSHDQPILTTQSNLAPNLATQSNQPILTTQSNHPLHRIQTRHPFQPPDPTNLKLGNALVEGVLLRLAVLLQIADLRLEALDRLLQLLDLALQIVDIVEEREVLVFDLNKGRNQLVRVGNARPRLKTNGSMQEKKKKSG